MTAADDSSFTARLNEAVPRGRESVESALLGILLSLDGRAIGLWRIDGDALVCLGFANRDDMPAAVSIGFREATAHVPLDQTSLGIVKAIVSREPTIARVEATGGGLDGSASWLARFEANSSLAVPFPRDGEPVGVLAVSSREVFDLETGSGPRLVTIADRLRLPAD